MSLFNRKTVEEKLINKERERVHKEVLKMENEFRKEDKIPPKDVFVSLQKINKIYDNHVQAVYNFNLDIKPHEFIVFVGPSGCGKSTTLRMIAGLEEMTYGNLFINSIYSNDLQPKERDIAMVFQSYALYPHMTVFDNIAFGLKIRKVPTLQINKKKYYEKILEIRKIEKKLEKINGEISRLEILSKKENTDIYKEALNILKDNKNDAKTQLNNLNIELETIKKTPVLGINYHTIRRLNNDRRFYAKERKRINKEIVKLSQNKDSSCKESNLLNLNEAKSSLEEVNKNLEKTDSAIKYYKETKVEVYKNKHLSKREIKVRVYEAAKTLDLVDYLDRKPSALSGGQCQRVALGRAIVRNSKLFLMDEPLSNLDAKLRVQMRSEIVKLHNQLGTTTIYVTHDQTEAMTMASRIVVMSKGHIQQIGTPKEIYNHPANTFVASFIGSPAMNLFDVEYDNGMLNITNDYSIKLSDEYVDKFNSFISSEIDLLNEEIDTIDREIKAYDEYQVLLQNGKKNKNANPILTNKNHYDFNKIEIQNKRKTLQEYTDIQLNKRVKLKLGIRPEDIIRTEDKTNKQVLSNPFKTKVIVPELLGREYYVHFMLGDNELISKIQDADNIAVNDEVELAFNLEHLHLFDSISTKLIK